MLTMCRKKKRNSSEATATYAQSYLSPFRTIVPIKEIMRAKFMAGCKWLLRENGRQSLQGTCHSRPKTFEVPWPCLVRIRVSHQFLVFLQFFSSESFLPCLIWCLWPLKKNIFRDELNEQLNAPQKTERIMFLRLTMGSRDLFWLLTFIRWKGLTWKSQCYIYKNRWWVAFTYNFKTTAPEVCQLSMTQLNCSENMFHESSQWSRKDQSGTPSFRMSPYLVDL